MASIGINAFNGCDELACVFYGGTAEQWKNITIEDGNDPIINAEIICNSPEFVLPECLSIIESEAFAGDVFASVLIPANVTIIAPDAFADRTDLTVFGVSGSYAQTYATQKSFTFIPVA